MKNIRNDSRGMSHIMIPLIILVVVVLGVAGWFVWKSQKKSTSNSATSAVADAATQKACMTLYNDDVLCKFAAKYNPKASYKGTFSSTDASGAQTSFAVQADSKGNTSTTTSDGGKETAAYISLNGDTYIKDESDGSWVKYPKGNDTQSSTNPTSDLKIDFNDEASKPKEQQITYKKISTEACGKSQCYKYQVIDPSQPGTTSFVWFGTKDYQLHQWSFTDKDGSKSVGTFDYTSVTINAPTPVKAAPAAAGVPSQAEIQNAIDDNQQ